jgi:hypothetical protein
LALRRLDEVLEWQMVVLRGIGQRQEPGPIHSCNAVNIDRLRVGISEEALEGRLKLGIPVEDVRIHTVKGIQADISLGIPKGKPFGARIIVCAVNHMGNVIHPREALGQKGAGADEDPGVEPGRRVFQVIREEHPSSSLRAFL